MSYFIGANSSDSTSVTVPANASVATRGTIFQRNAVAIIRQANANIAAALVPAKPLIDQLPKSPAWKARLMVAPLNAIAAMFAPVQGIAEKICRAANSLRRGSSVVSYPGMPQFDMNIDAPWDVALPESTAKFMQTLRVAVTFMLLAAFDPALFAAACLKAGFRLLQWPPQFPGLSLPQAPSAAAAKAAADAAAKAASIQAAAAKAAANAGSTARDAAGNAVSTVKSVFHLKGYAIGDDGEDGGSSAPATDDSLVDGETSDESTAADKAAGSGGGDDAETAGKTAAAVGPKAAPGIIGMLGDLLHLGKQAGLDKAAVGGAGQIKNGLAVIPDGKHVIGIHHGMSTGTKVAIGIGVVGGVLGVGYYLSKR